MARLRAAAVEAQGQKTSPPSLEVEFDNSSDQDSTVIRLTGQTRADLLHTLTGTFSALELSITSAVIRSSRQGQVQDIFKVTDADGRKVNLPAVQETIMGVLGML